MATKKRKEAAKDNPAWTPRLIDKLRIAWFEDPGSADDIADKLGFNSKNAIIGKAHGVIRVPRPKGSEREQRRLAREAGEPIPFPPSPPKELSAKKEKKAKKPAPQKKAKAPAKKSAPKPKAAPKEAPPPPEPPPPVLAPPEPEEEPSEPPVVEVSAPQPEPPLPAATPIPRATPRGTAFEREIELREARRLRSEWIPAPNQPPVNEPPGSTCKCNLLNIETRAEKDCGKPTLPGSPYCPDHTIWMRDREQYRRNLNLLDEDDSAPKK